MTLYEALQDIGKGRFVDNGCDYDLIALAKGTYTFRNDWEDYAFTITLDGKQGENAQKIEREYFKFCTDNRKMYNAITSAEYKKGGSK